MTEGPRTLVRFGRRLTLALLSPAILGVYAFHPELAFLTFFGLVPWVLLYTDDREPDVSVWYYVFAAWIYWMLTYHQVFKYGWYAGMILATIVGLAPFLWAFGILLKYVHRAFRLPRILTVPILWVTTEWLRSAFALAHFDYSCLGYSQGRFPVLIQIADITGVYGLSFFIAAFNGLLADLYFAIRDEGGSFRRALRRRTIRLGALGMGAALLVLVAYGAVRVATARHVDGPRVAIVQPSIRHTIRNAIGVHLAQVLMTEQRIERGAADLIVWPENAVLDYLRGPETYLDDLEWLATRKDAWILLGALGRSREQPGRSTNGAFLLDRTGRIVGQYDKQLIFPFGEYVPLDEAMRSLSSSLWKRYRQLIRKSWGFLAFGTAGNRMNLFDLSWQDERLPFGAITCYENIYPPIPAEAARMGARFMAHLTSEGEVGGVLHEQLLRVCILRAVEDRMPYLRAGNTGISCIIDSAGKVREVLRGDRGQAVADTGVLLARIPLRVGGGSLYAHSRDAFVKLCVLTALAMFVGALVRRRPGPKS